MNNFKIGNKVKRKEEFICFGNWEDVCKENNKKPNEVFEVEEIPMGLHVTIMKEIWDDNKFDLVENGNL